MKPYISIVIPAYNASETLSLLLASLAKSTYKKFEVIIGDDASNEQLTVHSLQFTVKKKKALDLKIVRLTRNKGPAAARNAAAKRARGEVIVFLDSDVTVYPDTIAKIAGKFSDDHDLTAITGVWDKYQKTKAFFPQFKAIRDWSYWTNERDRDGYYYLFSTRIAAIRRAVFLRLGGFNEAFRQMEDVEFTYRIAKRYAIIFSPDVRVHHEFETFFPVAKKYFWRSFYWTKLYKERRKFDPVATTVWESMAGVTGAGVVGVIGAGIILFFILPLPWIKTAMLLLALVFLFFHMILLHKFLRFVYREKGFVFMMKALGVGLILYTIILSGAVYYSLKSGGRVVS
jgi:glycosyltransferase involved in cell wall biosynthesis